jgi:hypothetical protein
MSATYHKGKVASMETRMQNDALAKFKQSLGRDLSARGSSTLGQKQR